MFPLKGNAGSLPPAPSSAHAAPQSSCLSGRQPPSGRTRSVPEATLRISEDRGQLSLWAVSAFGRESGGDGRGTWASFVDGDRTRGAGGLGLARSPIAGRPPPVSRPSYGACRDPLRGAWWSINRRGRGCWCPGMGQGRSTFRLAGLTGKAVPAVDIAGVQDPRAPHPHPLPSAFGVTGFNLNLLGDIRKSCLFPPAHSRVSLNVLLKGRNGEVCDWVF